MVDSQIRCAGSPGRKLVVFQQPHEGRHYETGRIEETVSRPDSEPFLFVHVVV